jgi:vacuolar-type H+-ATPase subunit B/Vma2
METVLPLDRRERKKYVTVMLTDIVNYCSAVAVASKEKQTGYQTRS